MLRIHEDTCLVATGSNLFIFRAFSPKLERFEFTRKVDVPDYLPGGENQQQKDAERRDKQAIIDCCFSQSGKLFALVTSYKQLVVYECQAWALAHKSIGLHKTPSRVHFDRDCKLVVSDRAGSIRVYKCPQLPTEAKGAEDAECEEILGHISMLLDFCFSADGRFILSADRDEKIRVSRYPDSFVIESYCLGHSSFINTVTCPPANSSIAVSSGGDSTVRIWAIPSGEQLASATSVCTGPIRKVQAAISPAGSHVTTVVILPDPCDGSLPRLAYIPDKGLCAQQAALHCDDSIQDINTTAMGEILALGRKGIYYCSDADHSLKLATLSNLDETTRREFLDSLAQHSAAPLTELEKMTGFENIKTYRELKDDRMKRKKLP